MAYLEPFNVENIKHLFCGAGHRQGAYFKGRKLTDTQTLYNLLMSQSPLLTDNTLGDRELTPAGLVYFKLPTSVFRK
jgi:hypothetical protein